jgi:hypothetical protein
MNRFFFHSFPRPRNLETREDVLRKGALIARSLLDNGLLLTPECYTYPLLDNSGGVVDIIEAVQRRICFTELEASGLPQHSETFGPFALVYEVVPLRRLGALPIFYIPLVVSGGYLSGLASELLAGLTDASRIVSSLAAVRRHLASSAKLSLDYRGRSVAFAPEQADAIRFFIDTLMDSARADLGTTESRLRTTASCFYPTENPDFTEPLHYYRQREWRIVGGPYTYCGAAVAIPATVTQVAQLEGIDATFFRKELRFADPGSGIGATVSDTIARRSHFLCRIGDLDAVGLAKCFVVPDGFVDTALSAVFQARGVPMQSQTHFCADLSTSSA